MNIISSGGYWLIPSDFAHKGAALMVWTVFLFLTSLSLTLFFGWILIKADYR